MPRENAVNSSKERRKRATLEIKNLTYEEAHYAVMSALSCERSYPMDKASVQAMAREADEWLRRAHQFYTKKFDRSIYDPDEILYRLYRQLRIELGWTKIIPRTRARQFWLSFWERALEEEGVRARHEKRGSPHDKKLWRDQVRGRVKARFKDEVRNGALFAELSPAVLSFYAPQPGEMAFPLCMKPTGHMQDSHK